MTRVRSGPGDHFAEIMHDLIRRDGGPGNWAQLRFQLAPTDRLDCQAVARSWQCLQRHCPLLQARFCRGLRGPHWRRPGTLGPAQPLRVGSPTAIPRLEDHRVHLHLSPDAASLVMTWDHRLFDVRAALALFQALADDHSYGQWVGAAHDQRWLPSLPRPLRQRGPMAQRLPKLMKPLLGGHWRPRRQAGGGLWPLTRGQAIIPTGSPLKAVRQRQRAATGRFGEAAYQLAAVAAALHAVAGARGRMIMPLAVDLRPPEQRQALINGHGFIFAQVDADQAAGDLSAAAQAVQRSHKAWVAAGGVEALLAGLSFFPWVPLPFIRRELGLRGPGLGASVIGGMSGVNPLPERLAGARVLGVDHLVVPTASPGLSVLIHQDPRGLVIEAQATAAVTPGCPPAALCHQIAQTLAGG